MRIGLALALLLGLLAACGAEAPDTPPEETTGAVAATTVPVTTAPATTAPPPADTAAPGSADYYGRQAIAERNAGQEGYVRDGALLVYAIDYLAGQNPGWWVAQCVYHSDIEVPEGAFAGLRGGGIIYDAVLENREAGARQDCRLQLLYYQSSGRSAQLYLSGILTGEAVSEDYLQVTALLGDDPRLAHLSTELPTLNLSQWQIEADLDFPGGERLYEIDGIGAGLLAAEPYDQKAAGQELVFIDMATGAVVPAADAYGRLQAGGGGAVPITLRSRGGMRQYQLSALGAARADYRDANRLNDDYLIQESDGSLYLAASSGIRGRLLLEGGGGKNARYYFFAAIDDSRFVFEVRDDDSTQTGVYDLADDRATIIQPPDGAALGRSPQWLDGNMLVTYCSRDAQQYAMTNLTTMETTQLALENLGKAVSVSSAGAFSPGCEKVMCEISNYDAKLRGVAVFDAASGQLLDSLTYPQTAGRIEGMGFADSSTLFLYMSETATGRLQLLIIPLGQA